MPQSATAVSVLLVPGLWNSGPDHWQSFWERERTDCHRIEQSNWETPHRDDWVAAVDAAIQDAPGPVVLAAHSLACVTVAHWAQTASTTTLAKVHGALLVGPSDTEAPSYPPGTVGFVPIPVTRLPFPTIVVASTDDEYVTAARAAAFARAWGAELVSVGAKGHINSASRLGRWLEGEALLNRLIAGPAPRA